MSARRQPAARTESGFTLLEIMISMAIFTVLGTMVVYFMRQSLSIFYTGTRESAMLDRMDTVLPQVRSDLQGLIIPSNFDAPPPVPTQEELDRAGRDKPPAPPPVLVRVRSGFIYLLQVGDEAYKRYPCPYIAFVIADAGEWSNKHKRRAGEEPTQGKKLDALTPSTVISGDRDTVYLPTGGLTEVCWIAVPTAAMGTNDGPSYPAVMTLYRGFRTPIGDPEKSLLVPENLDTPAKIKKACRPVAEGLLHFGALWRRVFATSWDESFSAGVGETSPYVGRTWDSTRALDKEWPLHRGKESLTDPSDDIFPAFVMLEATLANATQFGPGRGEFRLREPVAPDAVRIKVTNTDPLLVTNLGKQRFIKIGSEWLEYTLNDVDYTKNEVRVRRGRRGTKATAHQADSWCYVGLPAKLEIRLPVYRDHFVKRDAGSIYGGN